MSSSEPFDLVVQAPEIATADLKQVARISGAAAIEALQAASTQAFRLLGSSSLQAAARFCAEAGYDCAAVPRRQRLDRVRLVAMDMDSTLITIECVDEIADLLAIKPQVAAITAQAMRGEIDFAESLTRRVALLRGADVSALQRVYDERLRLSEGAERMLNGFSRVGAKSLLVSGGFTFFTERLKARLGLDYATANVLELSDDKLTGRIASAIVDGAAKAQAFERLSLALRGDSGLTVAIGDGANDLPVLRQADVSIAYHAKPIVRDQATYAIDHCGLDAVLNLFRQD